MRGVDGLVACNHGGRQIEGAIGSLDALPHVVAAGDMPVLFDLSGHSGAKICKAWRSGARGPARPAYVYGLAAEGQAGVLPIIAHITAKLVITMAVTGCQSLAEIGRDKPLFCRAVRSAVEDG